MKLKVLILAFFALSGCSSDTNNQKAPQANHHQQPTLSFTFDDGITSDIVHYKFKDWNNMILQALKGENLKSVFFVTGSNKLDEKGKYLLNSWSGQGHQIANHTYTHPSFNNEELTLSDFERELLQTDSVISQYSTYTKLFRFPYLKEGRTTEKISGYRDILAQHNYKNGSVTIDASDWYINSKLIKSIRKDGPSNPQVKKYKEYYLQHILERANYYEKLSYELTNRHISHTLLLHHNLTSALFLTDLIQAFKKNGWKIIDADVAFEDEVFQSKPQTVPAGESLIWSLAKESGKYEAQLRYPAEDSRYEEPKMKKLGI